MDAQEKYYPLEKTIINFKENGKHDIVTEFLFESPQFDDVMIQHIYQNTTTIILKIEKGVPLSVLEYEDVPRLPKNCLLCFLHGYVDAVAKLKKAKDYIKKIEDKTTYIKYKEAMRAIRKVKYS